MTSNVALFSAASRLENLMIGTPQKGPIVDSTVAQVSAFLYYQANVIQKLESNAAFKMLFKKTIFNKINEDFGLYIDSKARTQPKSLHHMYEWGKVGVPEDRLFKLSSMDAAGLSFKINYDFKLSKTKVPRNNSKQTRDYVFAKKASVIEAGTPIIIHPTSTQRLVFQIDGILVFMPKGASVTVKRPGGPGARNQFSLAYNRFFNGQMVSNSIKSSGFQNIFNSKLSKALDVPLNIKKVRYSFAPNTIRSEADMALTEAFGGSL